MLLPDLQGKGIAERIYLFIDAASPSFFILSYGVFSSSFFSPSNPASARLVPTSSPNSSTSRALPRWSAAVRVDVASVDWFLYGVVFKPQRRGAVKKKKKLLMGAGGGPGLARTTSCWRRGPRLQHDHGELCLPDLCHIDGGERPLPHHRHPRFCLPSGSARLSARTLLKTTPGCFLRI